MRRRKSFLSLVSRLSFEEKLVGAASLVTIVACFLPWYGITSRIMDQWWNGFSNIGYIIGYTVFVIALASLYGIAAPLFSLPNIKALEQKTVHFLLHGEAAFLLVLLSFIYARYTVFDAPGSSVRFGLYTALIASFVGAISGYVIWRKHISDLKRKGIQEDFIQMPRVHNEYAEMEMEPEVNDSVYDEQEMLMPEEEDAGVEEVYAEAGQKHEDLDVAPENVDKEKTIEELTSSYTSEHKGLELDEENDESFDELESLEDTQETQEKEEKEAMRFDF